MRYVILASVLFASLVFSGCVQQGSEKAPTVSVAAVGTSTPYIGPTVELTVTVPSTPVAAATAAPVAEIVTVESDESADAAIAETEALDDAGNVSADDDIEVSDLDRLD
ncbi:MAG TPA: hypothetical protein VI874_01380 [Candidatus Norongarragalinales archaeon]|nr:hypothetical protein [Candidatus Norongarragalinales archaeon]